MNTVGSYEAKTHLARLLEEVSRGEQVVITRHGTPIAVLKPYEGRTDMSRADVIRELQRFRAGRRLNGPLVRDLIEEGRS